MIGEELWAEGLLKPVLLGFPRHCRCILVIAPVLLIVIAIAGLAFGRDAAQNAITAQLSGLMGQ